jgi:hypothetical protein
MTSNYQKGDHSMKSQNDILDKSKYQKIKTGFVTILQEARKQQPKATMDIIPSIFETLSNIDCFFDESAATGHFLKKSINGHSLTLKLPVLRKLNESFREYAALSETNREAIVEQLKLSIAVEQLKIVRMPPMEVA